MAFSSFMHTIIAKAGRVLLLSLCTILAPWWVVFESVENILTCEEIDKDELTRSWVDMKVAEYKSVITTVISLPPMTYIIISRVC